ncbi:hypothetical protein AZ54_05990 [Xanthomonas oryzae pv. oryzae PXO86]|nr:hypothetical protein AZ54_05990 [Xanthomonas oryzae pv. oryzae PXO86]
MCASDCMRRLACRWFAAQANAGGGGDAITPPLDGRSQRVRPA